MVVGKEGSYLQYEVYLLDSIHMHITPAHLFERIVTKLECLFEINIELPSEQRCAIASEAEPSDLKSPSPNVL